MSTHETLDHPDDLLFLLSDIVGESSKLSTHQTRSQPSVRRAPYNRPLKGRSPQKTSKQNSHNVFADRRPPPNSKNLPLSTYIKGKIATPSNSSQPNLLLKLPGELRNRIYNATVIDIINPRRGRLSLSDPGLLLTNHQLRTEALSYSNKQHFYIFRSWSPLMRWINSLLPGQLDKVHNVAIDVAGRSNQPGGRWWDHAKLQTGMERLREIAEDAQGAVRAVRMDVMKSTRIRAAAPWVKVWASIEMEDGRQEWSRWPFERWCEVHGEMGD